MRIEGSVALVTGASAGIGRATSLALSRAGARVAMAARREERLRENAAQMGESLVLPTDLADRAAVTDMVERTVAHFGRIDILINNAGESRLTPVDAIAVAEMRAMLDVNLMAAVVATSRALPVMRRQHGGIVVNVGSPGGYLGVPFYGSYAASKAAMHAWSRTLQAEWAGSEIYVVEVQPGVIETEMHAAAIERSAIPDASLLAGRDGGPAGAMRPMSADDVAAAIVDAVRMPRPVIYTSPAIRYGSIVAYVGVLRRRFMAQLASGVRQRTGWQPFHD